MKMESLKKLYVHELKDLYSAETQILDALPNLIDVAQDEGLKDALGSHHEETRRQVSRLERIFEGKDFSPRGHRCKGMEGLIEEGRDLVNEDIGQDVLDASIIAAAQRVEHYEIASYGSARAHARKLGEHEDVELLTKSLEEESAADRKLTELAERRINVAATV
ncbi:MAG: ferritin-like domain-containing protein [Gemmatimonadota bacterium]